MMKAQLLYKMEMTRLLRCMLHISLSSHLFYEYMVNGVSFITTIIYN